MKNVYLLLPVLVVVVFINISTTNAADDIAVTTFTLKTPDPAASGSFTQGTAANIVFDLVYTVDTSATPVAVKVYFKTSGGTKSTEVTAGGSAAPTSSSTAITAGGTYSGLTATITLDATNCADYTKLCAAATVKTGTTNTDTTNDEACADFGTGATKAGTKICNAGSSATTSSTLMALTMVIGAILSWKI
ncbi:uncharacterized protein LOC144454020 [Glandiceps talaboti]